MAAFISYSREDSGFAVRLVKDLKKTKYGIWFDQFDIPKGSRWDVEIQLALENCTAFLIILSPDSVQSQNVMDEVNYAIDENKQILPIKIKECHVPFRLRRFQYVDCVDQSYDECLNEIKDFLGATMGEKIETEKRLKELESQAIQSELRGDFWNALQSWYEIKRIDPSFPRVDIKIDELERELRLEKEKRNAAEKDLYEKAKREREERRAARKAEFQDAFTKSLTKLKTTLTQAKPVLIIIGVIALVILGYIFYDRTVNPPLLFFCTTDNETHTCEYTNKNNETKVISALDDAIDWSPVKGYGGYLYFASNRDGKAEIYYLNLKDRNAEAKRVTYTDDPYESWSPASTYDGYLYFTSNRDGKAEIYYLNLKDKNAEAKRVTYTDDPYESWSPAVTYDRYLYFTSNQDGKAEIYYLNLKDKNAEAKRVTYTDDPYESWSSVVRGKNIYFTSNMSGLNEAYILAYPQSRSISKMESWTEFREEFPYKTLQPKGK